MVCLCHSRLPLRRLQVAQAAHSAGVRVVLDAGGVDGTLDPALLPCLDILSPNETELARLTGMPTDSLAQVKGGPIQC